MIDPSINVIFRHQRIRCAESCLREHGECRRTHHIRDRRLNNFVSRPRFTQTLSVLGHRLDVDPPPATLKKGLADRINIGILSANVDVKAGPNIAQGSIEHDVLKILRVRLKRSTHRTSNTKFMKSPSV